MFKEGDSAPVNVKARNIKGEVVSLEGLKDEMTLIYFYPKDGTPGCTLEAKGFQKILDELKQLKVKLIGVSRDSHESHEKFCAKNNLEFEVWSDVDGKFCEAFGVIVEKNMFGKKFMGIQRSTFLLDKNYKIIKIWPKVSPAGHPMEVLQFIRKI